jgi:hypothetical protein
LSQTAQLLHRPLMNAQRYRQTAYFLRYAVPTGRLVISLFPTNCYSLPRHFVRGIRDSDGLDYGGRFLPRCDFLQLGRFLPMIWRIVSTNLRGVTDESIMSSQRYQLFP